MVNFELGKAKCVATVFQMSFFNTHSIKYLHMLLASENEVEMFHVFFVSNVGLVAVGPPLSEITATSPIQMCVHFCPLAQSFERSNSQKHLAKVIRCEF